MVGRLRWMAGRVVMAMVVFLAVLGALFSALFVLMARFFEDTNGEVSAGRRDIREGDDELLKMVVDWGSKKDGGML